MAHGIAASPRGILEPDRNGNQQTRIKNENNKTINKLLGSLAIFLTERGCPEFGVNGFSVSAAASGSRAG